MEKISSKYSSIIHAVTYKSLSFVSKICMEFWNLDNKLFLALIYQFLLFDYNIFLI